MKILSRYVFREILASSFLATALATFVIFLKGMGKLFELLVHSAKGPAVIELFVLALPPILCSAFLLAYWWAFWWVWGVFQPITKSSPCALRESRRGS